VASACAAPNRRRARRQREARLQVRLPPLVVQRPTLVAEQLPPQAQRRLRRRAVGEALLAPIQLQGVEPVARLAVRQEPVPPEQRARRERRHGRRLTQRSPIPIPACGGSM